MSVRPRRTTTRDPPRPGGDSSTHEPGPRPQGPAQAQETPSLTSLTALLDSRAQADAQRLEQVHAEHRAVMAITLREHRDELRAQVEAEAARTAQLLCAHRDELRAQREADATRTAQLLREVFAEHRTELARANAAHADHLAQQPIPDPNTVGMGELRAALLEQASLQREANEDVADQISALTTIVADLGHTVGMLAVAAAHKAQQSHLPTRPTFPPPPRVEPAPSASSPQGERLASTVSPPVEPDTARVGPAAPASSDTTPQAANQPSARPKAPPAQTRSEAAERARLQEALEDDSDDDIAAALASDDDDPVHRRRLPPLTALEKPDDQEDDDDV